MRSEGLARTLILAAAAFALSAGVAAADVAGLWRTISDKDGTARGVVEIVETGGVVSGRVKDTLVPGQNIDQPCVACPGAKKGQPIRGLEILWGFREDPKKPGRWTGGKILDPENGAIYSATLTLAPDGKSLTVRGYVGHPSLGRSQTWRRAP